MKALEKFFVSFLGTEINILKIRLSHKTTKRTSISGKSQEFLNILRKQFVGAIKTMSFTQN